MYDFIKTDRTQLEIAILSPKKVINDRKILNADGTGNIRVKGLGILNAFYTSIKGKHTHLDGTVFLSEYVKDITKPTYEELMYLYTCYSDKHTELYKMYLKECGHLC